MEFCCDSDTVEGIKIIREVATGGEVNRRFTFDVLG
jgi:hypothetical protein